MPKTQESPTRAQSPSSLELQLILGGPKLLCNKCAKWYESKDHSLFLSNETDAKATDVNVAPVSFHNLPLYIFFN